MSNYYTPAYQEDAIYICSKYNVRFVKCEKHKTMLYVTAEDYHVVSIPGGTLRNVYTIQCHKAHRTNKYECQVTSARKVRNTEFEIPDDLKKERKVSI